MISLGSAYRQGSDLKAIKRPVGDAHPFAGPGVPDAGLHAVIGFVETTMSLN